MRALVEQNLMGEKTSEGMGFALGWWMKCYICECFTELFAALFVAFQLYCDELRYVIGSHGACNGFGFGHFDFFGMSFVDENVIDKVLRLIAWISRIFGLADDDE